MSSLTRWAKHLWLDAADSHKCLNDAGLARLEQAITQSEARHLGELRICVEGGLSVPALWRGMTARERAVQLFSELRVWDTAHNNGVLIYLLLADHRIEILADRGLNDQTPSSFWDALTQRLATTLQQNDFEAGLTLAVEEIGKVLHELYPLQSGQDNVDELPNSVVLI